MTDIAADLMAALEGEEELGEALDPDNATFDRVTEWVAQVNSLEARKEEYVAAHKAAVAKLTERLNDRVDAFDQQIEVLTDAIETYHRARLVQDPEARTLHTPTGTIKSRAAQDRFSIDDDKAFIEWAMVSYPSAVDFPDPKIDRREARKLLKVGRISDDVLLVDGEAVPGVKVEKATEAERTFKVVP